MKTALGIIVITLGFLVYSIDRIICTPLFWITIPSFKNWAFTDDLDAQGENILINDFQSIWHSIWRVGMVLICVSIYSIVQLFI